MPRDDRELWRVVELLQREAGGGVAKAIQVTCFFDPQGRLIGRGEAKTVKLYPGNVSDLIGLMFGNTQD